MEKKVFTPEIQDKYKKDRVLRFISSDETIDRAGDVIKQDGWVFDNFNKNAPFLWCHNSYEPPIGEIKDYKVEGKKLITDHYFSKEYPFADMIFRMYLEGTMKAVSVGFNAIQYSEDEDNDGYIFQKQDILEISACPIGCNPNALITDKSYDSYSNELHKLQRDVLIDKALSYYSKNQPRLKDHSRFLKKISVLLEIDRADEQKLLDSILTKVYDLKKFSEDFQTKETVKETPEQKETPIKTLDEDMRKELLNLFKI